MYNVQINWIFSEENGEYVWAENPVVADRSEDFIVFDGLSGYTFKSEGVAGEYWFMEITGRGNLDNISDKLGAVAREPDRGILDSSQIWYNIDDTFGRDVRDVTLTTSDAGGGIRMDSITGTVLWRNNSDQYPQEITITKAVVPVEVGGGSGGSSDNGSDLGVAGTILAVVPIFVILGILMYAVQYFRDPRKL